MDGDERNQPTKGPDSGSDWSIEDFDDFSAFEGLDLGADQGGQPQLSFDEPAEPEPPGAVAAVAADAETGGEHPAPPSNPPAEAADGGGAADDAADKVHLGDAHDATATPAEPPTGVPAGEAAEVLADADLTADSAFGFEAPSEPEASMGRSHATPEPAAEEPTVFDHDDVPDFSSFTQEHYVQATTQEYVGLAEEVARSAAESPTQMAVAAGIPGLESGVVGLEDVLDDADDAPTAVPSRSSGSELSVRVLTAVALIALFFGSLYQDYLVAILIFTVMMVAATEFYVVLTRVGHRPMTLFGLLGVGWALFGTWYWGTIAIPVVLVLTALATLVFFGVVAHRKAPLLDAALTMLVVAWIGGLGSLSMDIAFADRFAWMIAAVVVITALMDVAQYFVGRRLGKRPLAPSISPKKTVEGLIGGVVVALAVGAVFGNLGPFELIDGLVLGAIVAITGPLGDLAVSVVKRTLGVKDMGAVLPGHGGVLDRIDAMLFVIPAAWVAYSWMGLIAP